MRCLFEGGKIKLSYNGDFTPYGEGWGSVNNAPAVKGRRLFVPTEDIISYSNPTIVQAKIFAFDIDTGEVLWHRIIDGPGDITNNFASPVIYGNYLYQITGSGLLAALSLDTGENKNPAKWPKQLGPQFQNLFGDGAFNPSPAVFDGKLFISSGNAFYVIDLTTDEIIVEHLDPYGIENFAIDTVNRIVYGAYGTEPEWGVPVEAFGIRAYHIDDILAHGFLALPIWHYDYFDGFHNQQIRATPIFYQNMVYFTTLYRGTEEPKDRLYALDANTGDISWSLELPGDVYATGVVENSYLYQPAGRYILKIDLRPDLLPEDRVIWTYTSPTLAAYSFMGGSPVLANGMLFASVPFGESTYDPMYERSNTVVRIDTATGLPMETYIEGSDFSGSVWNGPLVAGNYLIVAMDGGIQVFRSPIAASALQCTGSNDQAAVILQ